MAILQNTAINPLPTKDVYDEQGNFTVPNFGTMLPGGLPEFDSDGNVITPSTTPANVITTTTRVLCRIALTYAPSAITVSAAKQNGATASSSLLVNNMLCILPNQKMPIFSTAKRNVVKLWGL